jgi:hypothetical protein
MDLLEFMRQGTSSFMDSSFGANTLADTISANRLQEKEVIDTFRVNCEFDEESLNLVLGFYIDGQFYQIDATTLYPSQSLEVGRGMLVTIANTVFGEVIRNMDLINPRFKPVITNTDVVAINGKVETIWANIQIRVNLNA